MLIRKLIASALFITVIWAQEQDPCQNALGEVICSDDCSKLILCLGSGHTYEVQTCDTSAGIYCYAPLKDCSSVHNSCNNSAVYTITCHTIGMFPDPEDCKWYHMCMEENEPSVPKKCGDGFGYNASTYKCSSKLDPDVGCQPPFGTCSKIGDVFVNKDNKGIFSICIKDKDRGLIHDMYSCEGNDFDIDNLKCPEWDESDLSKIPFIFRKK